MANGLYSNEELIDALITDCNNAVNAAMGGRGIEWCRIMLDMVVKLANLKNGVHNDMKNRDENIALLEQRLKDAGREVEKISTEELLRGESNGSD